MEGAWQDGMNWYPEMFVYQLGTPSTTTASPNPSGFTAPLNYRFGTASSPVPAGAMGVTESTAFNANLGYGWTYGWLGSYEEGQGTAQDSGFIWTTDATFAVNLANRTYNVTVTLGDEKYAHALMGVYLQNQQVDSVTTTAGQLVTKTYTVTITNGQLQLGLYNLGATDPFVWIQSLSISPA
jgi:hypothetical protein